ncbi:unnamed protein product [Brassicogethes aeneus]|uniref:Major facilitator superfamily (MFS) profile domain-containing protein n=1 Tax=Brassicogethes aeneus TaxID=1431903 RepID=A0A9P0FBC7_BRAAE|nr:unnamed protein product [Brassicogethes aeneus]
MNETKNDDFCENDALLLTKKNYKVGVVDNIKIVKHGEHDNKKISRIQKIPPRLRQFYVAIGPILVTTSVGMAEGYSAILLPKLEKEGNFEIDNDLSSWIASMAALPMALGCILGGYLMEIIGRKVIHMVACIPLIIGWLIIYYASDVNMILAGRFLTGFCVGVLGPPTGVYMSETSDPKFRGFLLAAISFAIALGIFLSHLLGTYMSWQNTALLCCSFPLMCVFVMIPAPESPTFLAKIGKIEKARKAFYWCRGYSEAATQELEVLIERQGILTEEPKKSIKEYFEALNKPEFLKPLMIIMIFFITMQWSGNNAISFYCVDIMKKTFGDNLDEYLSMLIIDTIRLVMSVNACILLKKIGRKPLAILSGVGTFLSLFVLSGFVFATKYYSDIATYTFVPMTCLVLYTGFITIGFVPLPWTMMGEVFPLANRGLGSGIVAMVNYIMIFAVVKVTPSMLHNLGSDGTFFTYAVCCFFGTIFLILYLPETKDKPLHVIEDYFKSKPNNVV